MRQFIHQNECRTAGQRRVEIEFADMTTMARLSLERQDAETVQQRGGLFASVGFHHANQHI